MHNKFGLVLEKPSSILSLHHFKFTLGQHGAAHSLSSYICSISTSKSVTTVFVEQHRLDKSVKYKCSLQPSLLCCFSFASWREKWDNRAIYFSPAKPKTKKNPNIKTVDLVLSAVLRKPLYFLHPHCLEITFLREVESVSMFIPPLDTLPLPPYGERLRLFVHNVFGFLGLFCML